MSTGRRPSSAASDLALILAQLGRHERQAEALVDLLLGAAGDPPRSPEEAVLVQLEALLDGELAERDVVPLAAGEVEQGGAEAPRGYDAQVDLESRPQADAGTGAAPSEDALDLGQADEGVHQRVGTACHAEQVGIADRLAATADRSRDHQLRDAGDGRQPPREVVDHREHGGEQLPPATGGARQRAQDVLLAALAEAGQAADLPRSRGGREVLHVRTPSVS